METKRILLRPWTVNDAMSLFRYASDPDVGPLAGWTPHKNVEESISVIRTLFTNDHTWAIVLKQSNSIVGCITFFGYEETNIPMEKNDCETGIWIAKPYWNQGIGTEALGLIIHHCFHERAFDNIWADQYEGNLASRRLLTKFGFTDTGRVNLRSQLIGGKEGKVKIYKLANRQ